VSSGPQEKIRSIKVDAGLIQMEAADGALFDFSPLRKRSLKSKCLADASTKFHEYSYLKEVHQT
jgi:hypothetical protein